MRKKSRERKGAEPRSTVRRTITLETALDRAVAHLCIERGLTLQEFTLGLWRLAVGNGYWVDGRSPAGPRLASATASEPAPLAESDQPAA